MINLIPAIQLFTLRDYIQTPADFAETIRRVREMDCDTVQFSRVGPSIPADFIADVVRDYDMKVCVTHSPLPRVLNDLPKLIKEHQSWGCSSIGIGNLDSFYLADGYEGYCRFLKDIAPAVEEMKQNGMTFAYHSHAFEFVRYHGKLMYEFMIENTDPEGFHFIQDSYWMKFGGLNHETWLEKVAGRMEVMHVKDFTTGMITNRGRVEGRTGTIGEGNIYYPDLLRKAEQTGVKVLPIEQDFCDRDPFACLKDAFATLKQILAEEGGATA